VETAVSSGVTPRSRHPLPWVDAGVDKAKSSLMMCPAVQIGSLNADHSMNQAADATVHNLLQSGSVFCGDGVPKGTRMLS
jgi:hypothetical protein